MTPSPDPQGREPGVAFLDMALAAGLIILFLAVAAAFFRYALGWVLDEFGALEAILAIAAGVVGHALLALALFRAHAAITHRSPKDPT